VVVYQNCRGVFSFQEGDHLFFFLFDRVGVWWCLMALFFLFLSGCHWFGSKKKSNLTRKIPSFL
jgi:hypothetical protein